MFRLFLCAGLALGLGAPASAQDAFEIPVQAEILEGWQQADGSRVAALRLVLKPGWKTYWRTPGDAGIPPRFDWSGSANLGAVRISWPRPQVFVQSGMRSIGYANEVVLPLAIAPRQAGKPIKLKARLEIGVCRDICVPQELRLSAMLRTQSSRPTPAITAALAARPLSAAEAGVKSARCRLTPSAEGLALEAQLTLPSTGGPEVVVIEANNPDLWMSESTAKRRAGVLTARADLASVSGGALAVDRSGLTITVLGRKQAVEIKGCTAS